MEWIILLILIVLVLVIIVSNINVVQQSRAYVIERLGAFSKVWQVGIHFKVPFIERVAKKVSLKEQVLDYPPQPVITKDNVTMQIDTVVYFQITDPKLYAYGVEHPMMAMETLTATTLRNIIGDLELDQTLTSRDVINTRMRAILDEALSADTHPLFVLCLGAITNVAAAIKLHPEIVSRMTIIWIGTQLPGNDEEAIREFNSGNDVEGANLVLTSGANLWLVPYQVYRTMNVSIAELQCKLADAGAIGEFLFDNLVKYNDSDFAFWTSGESWSLGDSPAVGLAMKHDCGEFHYAPAPLVKPDSSTAFIPSRPTIRIYDSIDSRFILEDLFAKLTLFARG